MRTLYICYLPLTEPLVETQVVTYLAGLAAAGHDVHLLTFESERRPPAEVEADAARLSTIGISWHRLRYHKRLSLLATAWDVVCGTAVSWWLVRRRRIDVLHARNHVPAAMALAVRAVTRARIVFDVRGLMAEEYADGGMWRTGSLPWRVTKKVERATVARAAGAIVLTTKARAILFGDAGTTPGGGPVEIIPTCADVESIVAAGPARDAVRRRLNLDGFVLAYAGKFSTWYQAAEMAAFFARLLQRRPDARFLVLTQSPPELIERELRGAGVPASAYVTTRVAPGEVGAHLAAADAAISFIAPAPSKVASSPTKIAEYLAAGLPIVVGAGVGDTDDLVRRHRVGVIVERHDPAAHDAALDALDLSLDDPRLRERCVAAARDELSLDRVGIPRYVHLYARLT